MSSPALPRETATYFQSCNSNLHVWLVSNTNHTPCEENFLASGECCRPPLETETPAQEARPRAGWIPRLCSSSLQAARLRGAAWARGREDAQGWRRGTVHAARGGRPSPRGSMALESMRKQGSTREGDSLHTPPSPPMGGGLTFPHSPDPSPFQTWWRFIKIFSHRPRGSVD